MSPTPTSTIELALRRAVRPTPAASSAPGMRPYLLTDRAGTAYAYGLKAAPRLSSPQYEAPISQLDGANGPMDEDRYTQAVHRLKVLMSGMLDPRPELGVCEA